MNTTVFESKLLNQNDICFIVKQPSGDEVVCYCPSEIKNEMKFESDDNKITISSTSFDNDPSKENILERSNGQYLCINKGDKMFECGLLGTFEATTNPGKDKILKFLLIGSSKVGKTGLLIRLCDGTFNSNIFSTVGIDFRTKKK